MAEQLAVRYAIPKHYDDFERMLRDDVPDVVHVTTPPVSHVSLAIRAMEMGSHVYVEKPFTTDTQEARLLIDTAKQTGRKITVGHSYEFDPVALAMRRLLEKGVLGDVVHVESYQGYNLQGPFGAAILASPSHWVHGMPGKLLQNNISHMLHKITEFVRDEEPWIRATGLVRRPERYGDLRDEMVDEMRVVMTGQQTTGYGMFSSHARPVRHFSRVFGTRNTVAVDYVNQTVTIEHADKLPSAIGRLLPSFAQSWEFFRAGCKNVVRFTRSDYQFFAGMNNLFRLFYSSILKDTEPPISYGEIVRVTRIMEEIFRQMESSERERGSR